MTATPPRLRRTPTLETLFVATFALLGLRSGLSPIGDNSFFTHLRTGIDMLDGFGIPRADPYSFTASGEPWVLQSWLASGVYGLLERIAGLDALVLLHGVLYGVLGWTVATLCRTGSALRTASAAAIATGIGFAYWSPRPLAIALVAFAFVVLVVERRGPAWVLIPLVWIWANSHGSVVLGGVWLVLVVIGGRRDARRYLAWFAGGCALAALNPLGPRLLLFAMALADKRDNFRRVVEWRPPVPPATPMVAVALVCSAAALGVVTWAVVRRRIALGEALPVAAFFVMGAIAQRNLAPAAVVAAPALAKALRTPEVAAGDRPAVNRAFAAVLVAGAAMFVLAALSTRPLDLDEYPSDRALAAASSAGERIVSTDVVGGYRILLDGRRAEVFVDDRYDMYPEQVISDYLVLLDGAPSWSEVLDRYEADAVVWPTNEELAASMSRSSSWRRAFAEDDWVVYVRKG